MRVRKLLAAVTASSLIATPVFANPGQSASPSSNPAASLSLAKAPGGRAATRLKKSGKLAPAVIIGVLATAAIIGAAVALANNDDDSDSN